MVRSNAFPTHDTSNHPPMQSVRKLSLILSGEKTLRTKRLTELLNQPIIYVKQRPLPSSPLTKHSPSRTRSFLTSPSPPLFSTAPFTTVPLSTLRVNPAASKNARNSCDRNSRLSIPFLSKAMPDSLHLSSADILQKFLAVFLHF